jgi:NTE family protein
MGNPALFPLIYNCKSSGIVIVHISIRCSAINPLFRKEVASLGGRYF